MANLVHQVVTVYKDDKGTMIGVCTCGQAYPLAGAQPGDMTISMHIALDNRNEAMGL